jgi:antitoxin ParD1/3/4
MALQITPQLEEKIDRMVSEGRYANASELVEQAVELLAEYDEQLEALRAKLQEGLDDIEAGREIEYTPEVFQRLIAEANANARMGKPIDDDVRP